MGQATLEKIMYTLTGCGVCVEIKKDLSEKIRSGEIDVRECDLDSTNLETVNICKEALDRPDFDGFPSLYDVDGTKEI